MVPFGGGYGPNGIVNLLDIIAVLDAFSGVIRAPYVLHNMDIAGPQGSCVPDEAVDLSDILAVLDAFAGIDPCSCGNPPVLPCCSGGAPAVPSSGRENVTRGDSGALTSRSRAVRRGGPKAMGDNVFEYDVFATDVVDLRGYQLGFDAEGALLIDTKRRDYVYLGRKTERRFDTVGMRAVNVLFDEELGRRTGVTRPGRVYLGTYRGPDENAQLLADRTMLVDSEGRLMDATLTRDPR